ncbi:MAG: peptide chain release factor N(5)-glutamine methyltransferase [Solirubrobacterales bacterium]
MARGARAVSPQGIGTALRAAERTLADAGVDQARLDAELLAAAAVERDRAWLHAHADEPLAPPAAERLRALLERRAAREPVAYILGRKGFRHIELEVDRRVLIPRPETELLVELAVAAGPASVLDVGSGSGAIALAVADELPAARVVATDTSRAALEVAAGNAKRLGLTDRVRLERGSVPRGERFDLILSNPPYVPVGDWDTLAPEIRSYEPRDALLAGPDGLDAVRALTPPGVAALAAQGRLAFEIGSGQAEETAAILGAAGLASIRTHQDLAGIERVVEGRRG